MIKRRLKFLGVSRQAGPGSYGFATKPTFAERPKLSQPCGFGSLTRGPKEGDAAQPPTFGLPRGKPIGKPTGSTKTAPLAQAPCGRWSVLADGQQGRARRAGVIPKRFLSSGSVCLFNLFALHKCNSVWGSGKRLSRHKAVRVVAPLRCAACRRPTLFLFHDRITACRRPTSLRCVSSPHSVLQLPQTEFHPFQAKRLKRQAD